MFEIVTHILLERKVKESRKMKYFLKRVTMSFSLINYLLLPERYAKGYNKYFYRIQWSPESSVCLIAFCTNEKTITFSDFSIIARDKLKLVILKRIFFICFLIIG